METREGYVQICDIKSEGEISKEDGNIKRDEDTKYAEEERECVY